MLHHLVLWIFCVPPTKQTRHGWLIDFLLFSMWSRQRDLKTNWSPEGKLRFEQAMGSGDWFKTIISKKKSKRGKSKHAKVLLSINLIFFFFSSLQMEEKNINLWIFLNPNFQFSPVHSACMPCMSCKQPEKKVPSISFHPVPSLRRARTTQSLSVLLQLGGVLLLWPS